MLLDGRPLAEKINEGNKKEISKLDTVPCLGTIRIGEDPASKIYFSIKEKTCERIGIKSVSTELPANTSRSQVIQAIDKYNQDETVHAILVQLPLPKHLDPKDIVEFIYPSKDVEGFHPMNMGRLVTEKNGITPCTPTGIIKLLKHYEIALKGKNVTIVGHSMVVGKPLALMLLKEWATVDICHIETRDLKAHTEKADIVISATGKPGLITADMIKEGAVVVDVGTTKVDEEIKGDVDFEQVKEKAYSITPVPGGVGPMTVAMLMKNTIKCAEGKR